MTQPTVNGRPVQPHDLWCAVGRVDCFAEQLPNGSYKVHQRKLNYRDLMDHLAGRKTYGTYTLKEDSTVGCVTFDVDSGDAGDLYKVIGLIEEPFLAVTSGGKGYHILKFWKPGLPAEVAHSYAQDIAERAGYKGEAFPRQAKAEGGKGLGSLTRLPFGVNQRTGQRSEYLLGSLDFSPPMSSEQESALLAKRSTKAQQQGTWPTNGGSQSGWLAELFEDSQPANGRNTTGNRLAWWLLNKGFPPDLVRLNLEYVNENVWAEPLPDHEIESLLRPR